MRSNVRCAHQGHKRNSTKEEKRVKIRKTYDNNPKTAYKQQQIYVNVGN